MAIYVSAKYMYRIENTPFNLDLTVHRVKFNNVGIRTALRKKVQFSYYILQLRAGNFDDQSSDEKSLKTSLNLQFWTK